VTRGTVLWVLTFLYAGLIFCLSGLEYVGWSISGENGYEFTVPSMVQHVGEFGVLGILLFLSFRSTFSGIKRSLFFSFSFGSFYGVLDEFHQWFVPHRCMTIEDMFADSIGVLLGCLFLIAVLKLKVVMENRKISLKNCGKGVK
jgi:hypothetical protein